MFNTNKQNRRQHRRKCSNKQLHSMPKTKWQSKVHVLFVGSVHGVDLHFHEEQAPRQRGLGHAIMCKNISVDAEEFCVGLRNCVVPFMARYGHTELIQDGATCYHTKRVLKTLRSCKPWVGALRRKARYPVRLMAGSASHHFAGCPPNSHDCNPLETVFAELQADVGDCFTQNAGDRQACRLREKICEIWPRKAAHLRHLVLKLPAVMRDIIDMIGAGTGR
jgi:hypothetical protein